MPGKLQLKTGNQGDIPGAIRPGGNREARAGRVSAEAVLAACWIRGETPETVEERLKISSLQTLLSGEGLFLIEIESVPLSAVESINLPCIISMDHTSGAPFSRAVFLGREGDSWKIVVPGRAGELISRGSLLPEVAAEVIYITDRQFENVQIFNQQGQILMAFGQEGKQAGQFWLPAGIFVDRRNRIYVADSFNKRIQIFELME